VFEKLLANALKRREPNVLPRIQISAERAPRAWHFSVSDNGPAIPRTEANEVFDVSSALERSAEFPGTGIGLAICKRVVERLNGRIWVDPEAGGAAFRFSVPDNS
jgi:signal transduction histidine kinase